MFAPFPLRVPRRPLTLAQLRERVVEPVLAALQGAVALGRSMPCHGFQLTSAGPARALHRSILVRLRPTSVRILVLRPRVGDVPVLADLDKGRVWVRLDADDLMPATVRDDCLLFRVTDLRSATAMAARVRPLLQRIAELFFRQELVLASLHQLIPGAIATEVLCPAQRTTHTEITAHGRIALVFDMGLRDHQLGVHFLEVRGRRRIHAAYRAFARYAAPDAWTVDESGLNIESLPLPTAAAARAVAARLAELPWLPLSHAA